MYMWVSIFMRVCMCVHYIIIIIIISCLVNFSHQFVLVRFHKSLSDNKSSQISRTSLSILTDLNNNLDGIDFSSCLFSKLVGSFK